MKLSKKPVKISGLLYKRPHSLLCKCREHIKCQTQHYHKLLSKLGSGKVSKRAQILQNCDPCFIRYLGKCASGVLQSAIKLPKKSYKELSDSKQLLVKIANPNVSVEKKRGHLISQIGSGFFPIIASIASSVLGNLLSKAING